MKHFTDNTEMKSLSPDSAFVEKMAVVLTDNDKVDSSVYGKYDYVKRGLRDANGAGVVVGLTKVGDVEGYKIDAEGKKQPVDGKLFYRGVDLEDIVNNCLSQNRFGFEETCYLLLFGELPTEAQLAEFNQVLGKNRFLPPDFMRDTILVSPSSSILNKLARSVLTLYSYDSNPDDTSVENVLRQSLSLIAYFPALVAYAYQAHQNYYNDKGLHIHYPDPDKSTAENVLRMIRLDSSYTDLEAKLLDLCLILHAEHGGGNNSSFTTRLITSSGTDTYSVIAAAIGSLKGPKHGGANTEVLNMIKDIKANVSDLSDEKKVEDHLIKILKGEAGDGSGLIYGLGHAVYTVSDPRAQLLKGMARKLAESKGMLEEFSLFDFIERRGPQLFCQVKGTKHLLPANVDLYSGFVYEALNIPYEIATPLFAVARIAGWCSHRLEELIIGGKIMRPAYQSVQPPVPYIPLSERK